VKLCCRCRLCYGQYIRYVWISEFVYGINGDRGLCEENGLILPIILMYDLRGKDVICELQICFYV